MHDFTPGEKGMNYEYLPFGIGMKDIFTPLPTTNPDANEGISQVIPRTIGKTSNKLNNVIIVDLI